MTISEAPLKRPQRGAHAEAVVPSDASGGRASGSESPSYPVNFGSKQIVLIPRREYPTQNGLSAGHLRPVRTENLIRVDDVMKSPKLAE